MLGRNVVILRFGTLRQEFVGVGFRVRHVIGSWWYSGVIRA